uniref:Prolyl 4-hydroxylase alpha subunit domain-containing protein n=1 Tax=Dendroctonus ponderosae TaxID=77166 RepID=J3JUJ9_DENPD|nr:unknown [Dendroctonus ponderosae]
MSAELKSRRKGRQPEPSSSPKKAAKQEEPSKTASVPYRYGPLPRFNGQRLFSRGVIIVGVVIYVWYFSKDGKETSLAKQGSVYNGRGVHVDCDEEYLEEIKRYSGCVPKRCGRYVSDVIVTDYEATTLLWLAKRGMSFGGSSGGATIMDLHSGALSYKKNFINMYKSVKTNFITPTDLRVYKDVRQKIQSAIADSFGLDVNKLFLTHPTFFSRLTSEAPSHDHDEYWHVHVDKHTYESFHYTSLVYLNDFRVNFKGGRFVYLDNMKNPRANVTVEPRKGRVSMFTSGAENPHFVERVTDGERFAITISFTCDSSKQIRDPSLSIKGQ